MWTLKEIGKFLGFVVGGILGGMAAAFCAVLALLIPSLLFGVSERALDSFGTALVVLGFVGGLVTGIVSVYSDRDTEERRRREEEQRRRDELDAAIFRVRQLVLEACGLALSLSSQLAQADVDLDLAERELIERRYSPFWEAMEEATKQLHAFNETLDLIANLKARHAELSILLGTLAPRFQLGIKTLPDPRQVHQRSITLYREAQTNPDFANIYELRRNTAVLIKGFTSLGQAIERLGDRVVCAVEELSRQMNTGLGSIEEAVRGSATAAAAQRTALLAELERSNQMSESMRSWLSEDAAKRAEHERVARRMLDNIQHRRRPTIWDS